MVWCVCCIVESLRLVAVHIFGLASIMHASSLNYLSTEWPVEPVDVDKNKTRYIQGVSSEWYLSSAGMPTIENQILKRFIIPFSNLPNDLKN